MVFYKVKSLALSVAMFVVLVNCNFGAAVSDSVSSEGNSELPQNKLQSDQQSTVDKRGKFYQWAGKRGKFYQWAGKRSLDGAADEDSNGASLLEKRGKFYQWAGKRAMGVAQPLKKAHKFYAWAGKRSGAPISSSEEDQKQQLEKRGKFYQWAGK